jgi:hypothetical protein
LVHAYAERKSGDGAAAMHEGIQASDQERRRHTPEERADNIFVDAAIRQQPGFRGLQFMHRSMKPLDQVDLSTAEDRGQINLFNNECEGMCGV